jgi:hypothetical protein
MELSESGIIEFFDGTYIDLSRIIEITPVRSPTGKAFKLRYPANGGFPKVSA